MAARDVLGRGEGSPYTSAPIMLYTGETVVSRGFRIANGKPYRVLLRNGCGSFTVRVYDPANAACFEDVTYRSLAAFVMEWIAI